MLRIELSLQVSGNDNFFKKTFYIGTFSSSRAIPCLKIRITFGFGEGIHVRNTQHIFCVMLCTLIDIIISLIGLGADESAGKCIELFVFVVVVVVVVVMVVVKMQDGALSFRTNSMPHRYTGN